MVLIDIAVCNANQYGWLKRGEFSNTVTINMFSTAQRSIRFKVIIQGKTAYIDSVGELIIPPLYYNGGDFSEGLAVVRENGLYGYINE